MQRLTGSVVMLFLAAATAHAAGDQIESKAGAWKTWVIASPREFRVATPPNDTDTDAEILDLKALADKRDAAASATANTPIIVSDRAKSIPDWRRNCLSRSFAGTTN